jgi:hypothetical protein
MFKPKTRFTTEPALYDIIPKPIPARHMLPDWFKKLAPFTEKDDTKWLNRTIKRCPPVLDALSTGYILTTPAEIELIISDEGDLVEWRCDFIRPVIEAHHETQITGNPNLPKPPLKFLNYWAIETPKGWSTLFVNPLNRDNSIIDAMSGIVETDKYFEYINFPSFLRVKGKTITIPRNYPIVQAIPFKRGMDKRATIEPMGVEDLKRLGHTRDRRSSQPSLYRETMWERK